MTLLLLLLLWSHFPMHFKGKCYYSILWQVKKKEKRRVKELARGHVASSPCYTATNNDAMWSPTLCLHMWLTSYKRNQDMETSVTETELLCEHYNPPRTRNSHCTSLFSVQRVPAYNSSIFTCSTLWLCESNLQKQGFRSSHCGSSG